MKQNKLKLMLVSTVLVSSTSLVAQESNEPIDCDLEENRNRVECVNASGEVVVEEIVVTGTYLKRDKFTSPSPVEVFTAADIEEAGAGTLGEFVRDLPFTTSSNTINNPGDFGSQAGFGGDRQDGTTTMVNIRGFGEAGTLTLVDGVRASSDLDVNGLATEIGLERVEVQLDGGGATYGADAIGGVVNFVRIKEFDGYRVKFYQKSDVGDYGESKLSFLTGWNPFDGGLDIVTSFEAQKRTTLSVLERPQYIRAAQSITDQANPGTFAAGNTTFLDPDCGAAIANLETDPGKQNYRASGIPTDNTGLEVPFASATTCQFGFDEYQDYLPASENYISNTNFRYELNEYFTAEYNLSLNWRERTGRASPFTQGDSDEIRIPRSHPAVRHPDYINYYFGSSAVDANGVPTGTTGAYGSAGFIMPDGYRPFGKLGTRPSAFNRDGSIQEFSENYSYNHSVNFDYDFGDTSWSGHTHASTNNVRVRTTELVMQQSRLEAAVRGVGGPNCAFNADDIIGETAANIDAAVAASGLVGSSGCEYFNPFLSAALNPNLANSQALVDWMVTEDTYNSLQTENRTWQTRVSGDLFELPAGPVQLALGHDFRERLFELPPNRIAALGDDLGGGGGTFFFSETVRSQFIELGVPVLDNLDISIAARKENYSDRPFGDITLPKYSISYRPIDDLVLRASVGESFTAPRGDQLDNSNPTSVPLQFLGFITDPFVDGINGSTGITRGGNLLISGNPDLRPQTTDNTNVGFTYRGFEGWEFSADLQEITYIDRFVNLSVIAALQREYNLFLAGGGDINSRDDVLAFLATSPIDAIDRNPDGSIDTLFFGPINAGEINIRIVDLSIRNRTDTRWGLFTTRLSATGYDEFLYVDESTLDETQADAVGKRNRNNSAAVAQPRWQAQFMLRWNNGNHSLVSTTNFVDGIAFDGNDVRVGATAPERINSFTTSNLRYTYSTPEFYGGDVIFSVGADNIFDREAQVLPIRQGLETRLQDPIGRTFYLDVTYDF